jgi:nickel-type superoxide dismutase maturation protease
VALVSAAERTARGATGRTGPAGFLGLAEWTALLALLAVMILLASWRLAVPWTVLGPSMMPTLRSGDRVIVDRWTYRLRSPRPGEVALVEGPDGRPVVKRVDRGPLAPATGVWLLGDNAGSSLDSRSFGPVPRERVLGRVVVRLWPPGRVGPAPSAP